MNRLQRRNRRLVRDALNQTRLIGSVALLDGNVIEVDSLTWSDYWEGPDSLGRELEQLHAAWFGLIEDQRSFSQRVGFVHAYFALLRTSLKRFAHGEIGPFALRKIVGFETFHVSEAGRPVAAGMLNLRNPAYMLSRLALPSDQDNPKYLPLICPFDRHTKVGDLHCHYRRISLDNSGTFQLFVYPPVEPRRHSSSYSAIGRLFRSLTDKNDPWIRKRCDVLFDCVFDEAISDCNTNQIRLLDVACGSARVTVGLCMKAFRRHRASFDLTLVDVVRVNRSLATTFYRNASIFDRLVFRQRNLFDWMEELSNNPATGFDIVLMLRIFDVFSHFNIEILSRHEMAMLARRDRESIPLSEDVLSPAKLIELGKQDEIQHTIKKTRLRRGSMFYQFSLSDYFKAMRLATGGEVDEGDGAYVPVRRFDEGALVLPK